jgi:hypothetical protein
MRTDMTRVRLSTQLCAFAFVRPDLLVSINISITRVTLAKKIIDTYIFFSGLNRVKELVNLKCKGIRMVTQNVLENHSIANGPELDRYGYWLFVVIQTKVPVYTSSVDSSTI